MTLSWITITQSVLGLVILIGPLVLPIILADKKKRLDRPSYAIRTIPLSIVIVVASYSLDDNSIDTTDPVNSDAMVELVFLLPVIVILLIAIPLFALWSVHRTQDADMNKWLNLLLAIPVVSLIFWIVLMVRKTKLDADQFRQETA